MAQQGEGAWARVVDEVANKFLVQCEAISRRLDSIDARLQAGDERMARLEKIAHASPCDSARGMIRESRERKEVVLRSETRRWNVFLVVLTTVLTLGFAMLLQAIMK